MKSRIIPGYKNDFARNASQCEPRHAHLWRGKVGHWCPSLGVTGLGTNAIRDISGYGNHGTTNGTMTIDDWVIRRYGYALDFDGSDDFVSLPNNIADFGSTGDFSIAFWFRNNNASADSDYVFSKSLDGSNYWYAGIRSDHYLEMKFFTTGGNTNITTSPTTYNDDLWHHAIYMRSNSGTVLEIYVDGILKSSLTGQTARETGHNNATHIGKWAGGGAHYYIGLLNDIRIYNRILSASEAMQLYVDPFADLRLRRQVVGKVPVAALNILDFERGTMRGSNRGILRGVG